MTTNGIVNKVHKLYTTFSVQNATCTQLCNAVRCWQWDISNVMNTEKIKCCKYAVIVLNRPVTQSQEFIKSFWNDAALRITVDGGTTHWNKFLINLPTNEQKMMRLPDLITGDFDSITKDLLEEYKKKGCKALHTPDQDDTDFTKSIIELNNYCKQHEIEMDHVMAIGQNSGRIDQILGNIQTLFLVRERQILSPNTKVYLMSDDTVSWLLSPGDHVVLVPEETRKCKRAWCSLVPVGETCKSVTTTGLKWNLNNQPLQFGVLVSTSNSFDGSEQVKIKCSHSLLWSMKVPSLFS